MNKKLGLAADQRAVCPCASGRHYDACCARLIEGHGQAATAEALMRSRYTAYAYGHASYLIATWHPATRPAQIALDPTEQWLGLQVRRHAVDPTDPTRAIVEFVARVRIAGRGHRLHETSRFVREAGRWFYLDAVELARP